MANGRRRGSGPDRGDRREREPGGGCSSGVGWVLGDDVPVMLGFGGVGREIWVGGSGGVTCGEGSAYDCGGLGWWG